MYSIFWLLLLSKIVLTFLHIVACSLLVYFYSQLVYPLYGHTTVCLRIHLLVDVWAISSLCVRYVFISLG